LGTEPADEADESILKPRKVPGLGSPKVFCIPADLPARPLFRFLEENSLRKKETLGGNLYLLEGGRTVAYGFAGAPATVMNLENLIASGAKEVMLLGFCGSLLPGLNSGDVVSVTRALSEEGTSRHYFARKRIFHSTPLAMRRLEQVLSERGISAARGAAVSTDAPYRETRPWLCRKREQGIAVVDMEASAVLAISEYRGVSASALLVVSDRLSGPRWSGGFHEPFLVERVKDVFLPFLGGKRRRRAVKRRTV